MLQAHLGHMHACSLLEPHTLRGITSRACMPPRSHFQSATRRAQLPQASGSRVCAAAAACGAPSCCGGPCRHMHAATVHGTPRLHGGCCAALRASKTHAHPQKHARGCQGTHRSSRPVEAHAHMQAHASMQARTRLLFACTHAQTASASRASLPQRGHAHPKRPAAPAHAAHRHAPRSCPPAAWNPSSGNQPPCAPWALRHLHPSAHPGRGIQGHMLRMACAAGNACSAQLKVCFAQADSSPGGSKPFGY